MQGSIQMNMREERIWTFVAGIGCTLIVLGDMAVMLADPRYKGRVHIRLGAKSEADGRCLDPHCEYVGGRISREPHLHRHAQ